MKALWILLAAAIAGGLLLFWSHEKLKKDSRDSILGKAREAKAAKSLQKNVESPETEN